MSEPIRLTTPLTQDKVRSLHIGDRVLISGTIYAARDAAHKRMVETLDRGEPLPVDLRDQIVYYVGPSPAKPGQAIGSAGPTTSGRMDAYAPRLMEKGLSGMIGKGNRSQAVKDAMQRYGTVYFAATGGAGRAAVPLHPFVYGAGYAELGPEALAAMEVVDFPVIVVGDVEGGDYYMEGPKAYAKR
ncbi:MAG: Fe-S-containing hydro-lyase [Bilophila wadsworthia]